MKKTLIAAAFAAAVTLGAAAGTAQAGVAGVNLAGATAHTGNSLTENVYYRKRWNRHGHRKWVCNWRHGRRHCYWRTWR
jgi:hypothetical protein